MTELDDVMAAVKADLTGVVKTTELIMEEMLDLRKEVNDQTMDFRADVKGKISQHQATLSEQIDALKSVILQEKGGQPQDDGKRTICRTCVPIWQSLLGGKQEEAEQGRADKADSKPSKPGSPASDWHQQLSFDYDVMTKLSRDSDTFPGCPETPPKHCTLAQVWWSTYDPYKHPSLLIPSSSTILDPYN